MIIRKTLSLIILCCLLSVSVALAHEESGVGIEKIKIDGEEIEESENVSILSGQIFEVTVVLEEGTPKDYIIDYADKEKFFIFQEEWIENGNYKALFKVKDDFSGKGELIFFAKNKNGENIGRQMTIAFDVEEPEEDIDLKIISPESFVEEGRIEFSAASKDMETYDLIWHITCPKIDYDETFSGNEKKKTLEGGYKYYINLTATRAGYVYYKESDFYVNDTERSEKIMCKTVPAEIVAGEKSVIDLTGTSLNINATISIYVEDQSGYKRFIDNLEYIQGRKNNLGAECFFEAGDKNILIEVNKFGKESPVKRESFSVNVIPRTINVPAPAPSPVIEPEPEPMPTETPYVEIPVETPVPSPTELPQAEAKNSVLESVGEIILGIALFFFGLYSYLKK